MGKSLKRISAIDRRLRDQRKHEIALSLLDAMKKDPELKYYLGVAGGAGLTALGGLIGAMPDVGPAQGSLPPTQVRVPKLLPDWAMLLSPALAVHPLSIPNWMKWSSGGGSVAKDPFEIVGGTIALMGMGFSGFCAGILILKALFGEQGMAEVLKGIGEIVPG
jgi:hypothetical protein